jgi:hypothetical protein
MNSTPKTKKTLFDRSHIYTLKNKEPYKACFQGNLANAVNTKMTANKLAKFVSDYELPPHSTIKDSQLESFYILFESRLCATKFLNALNKLIQGT